MASTHFDAKRKLKALITDGQGLAMGYPKAALRKTASGFRVWSLELGYKFPKIMRQRSIKIQVL